MSVINSDMSRASVAPVAVRPDQQLESEAFIARQQEMAKVVQEPADTDKSKQQSDAQTQDLQAKKDRVEVSESLVADSDEKMRQLNVQLSFELTDDGDNSIVKVVDQNTGDVVRQIPTEEFLKFSEKLDDIIGQLSDLKGSLVDNKV